MPIINSAKKRVRTAAKATVRNRGVKRDIRTAMKSFDAAIEGGKSTEISAARNKVDSVIDTAAKKNIMHRNKAARKKAQVAKAAKAAGAAPAAAPKKKAVKKAAPKKAAAKKAPAKKAVVKKAPAKKPAAKKAPAKKAAPKKKPAAKK